MAVKTLTNETNSSDRVKFLREAAITGQFRHSNVVRLYGVVTLGSPVSKLLINFFIILRLTRVNLFR